MTVPKPKPKPKTVLIIRGGNSSVNNIISDLENNIYEAVEQYNIYLNQLIDAALYFNNNAVNAENIAPLKQLYRIYNTKRTELISVVDSALRDIDFKNKYHIQYKINQSHELTLSIRYKEGKATEILRQSFGRFSRTPSNFKIIRNIGELTLQIRDNPIDNRVNKVIDTFELRQMNKDGIHILPPRGPRGGNRTRKNKKKIQ